MHSSEWDHSHAPVPGVGLHAPERVAQECLWFSPVKPQKNSTNTIFGDHTGLV